MPLSNLPIELLIEIISYALLQNSTPSHVLRLNKAFLSVAEPILYSNLHFNSTLKLSQFAHQRSRLDTVYQLPPPRSLNVTLAGGAAGLCVFQYIRDVLQRCREWNPDHSQIPLQILSLCLHSHSNNPELEHVYDALSLANPQVFTWRGPDPSHHFSTAVSPVYLPLFRAFTREPKIVPAATAHLLRAISAHWTRLQCLTLTNIAFPSDQGNAPLIAAIPTLRRIYLGQVTMLSPGAVAMTVLQEGMVSLERVQLVDAYRESIWGARIRRSDIESAALASYPEASPDTLEKIRDIVSCEARTERIMGGDRVDSGISILL